MSPERKSEGWKIPLLFCGGVLLITGTVSLLKNKTPEIALPPALVEKARNSGIDMNTPANRPWQDKILAAASGFAARDDKDRKLLALAETPLAEKNFDAACPAFSLISTV
ncbi:MAG: GTP cyclohydrolase, partial [Desulfovibrio sp.]|nr:GTP cyclohydrolase [Desulfovibrio sp.]